MSEELYSLNKQVFHLKKSQIFSIDLNVSLFLFISFTLFSIFLYNYTSTQVDDYISLREMENLAVLSTDTLVLSSGFPSDWNSTNFIAIGLADEENVLNYTKLLEFNDSEYYSVKLMITQGLYDFYVNVTYFDGSVVLTYGDTDISSSKFVVPLRRFCLLDDGTRRPVYFDMVIWK